MSYGEKKVGNKEKVDGETDREEELVRDGKEFWVGPIDVSGQQEQPAPGNWRYKKALQVPILSKKSKCSLKDGSSITMFAFPPHPLLHGLSSSLHGRRQPELFGKKMIFLK